MSKVHLSSHLTFSKIFRLTIAPILMMVISSLYSVADGFFVSNFAGGRAFTAVNLVMPVIMIVAAIGFMFATGGSAFVAALLGKKEEDRARQAFSMIIYVAIVLGLIVSFTIFLFIDPIVRAMASLSSSTSEETIADAVLYGRIMLGGCVLYILQNTFQGFFAVAEKPSLGFIFTLAAGVTNAVFDCLFIGVFKWGVAGAAAASLLGQAVGGIGPFLYFLINRKNTIYLGKPELMNRDLWKIISNGSSELVSSLSTSLVSIVFNLQLLKYVGEEGVSAYGIIMYVSYIFIAMFLGYSIGIAPAISYQYGADNKKELTNIYRHSLLIITCFGIVMTGLSEVLAQPFSHIFSSGSATLEELSTTSMRIYSICYLFCGFSIFGSSFFTALNNGLISALISFIRTIGFQLICVIFIPLILGVNGIWWSMVIAEAGSFIMTWVFWIVKRKKYGY